MNANKGAVLPTGTENSLADDLLRGVPQIAKFIDEEGSHRSGCFALVSRRSRKAQPKPCRNAKLWSL